MRVDRKDGMTTSTSQEDLPKDSVKHYRCFLVTYFTESTAYSTQNKRTRYKYYRPRVESYDYRKGFYSVEFCVNQFLPNVEPEVAPLHSILTVAVLKSLPYRSVDSPRVLFSVNLPSI